MSFCRQAINILLSEMCFSFFPFVVKLVHHYRAYAFIRVYPGVNAIKETLHCNETKFVINSLKMLYFNLERNR